jgi:hypothetical protein
MRGGPAPLGFCGFHQAVKFVVGKAQSQLIERCHGNLHIERTRMRQPDFGSDCNPPPFVGWRPTHSAEGATCVIFAGGDGLEPSSQGQVCFAGRQRWVVGLVTSGPTARARVAVVPMPGLRRQGPQPSSAQTLVSSWGISFAASGPHRKHSRGEMRFLRRSASPLP